MSLYMSFCSHPSKSIGYISQSGIIRSMINICNFDIAKFSIIRPISIDMSTSNVWEFPHSFTNRVYYQILGFLLFCLLGYVNRKLSKHCQQIHVGNSNKKNWPDSAYDKPICLSLQTSLWLCELKCPVQRGQITCQDHTGGKWWNNYVPTRLAECRWPRPLSPATSCLELPLVALRIAT